MHSVPFTTLATSRHPADGCLDNKEGSVQTYVANVGNVYEHMRVKEYSVHDVHAIGVIDIQMVQTDRNDENILVRHRSAGEAGSGHWKLVPIDAGLALPDRLSILEEEICWLGWPQTKAPFSAEMLSYIGGLCGDADATMLRSTFEDGVSRDTARMPPVCFGLRRSCFR